jgi:uncharacterized membrane protein
MQQQQPQQQQQRSSKPVLIISALVIIFGIIHLAVGIGIVGRYRQYDDIFRQPVGLASFNIVIGLFAIVVGIMALLVMRNQSAPMGDAVNRMWRHTTSSLTLPCCR